MIDPAFMTVFLLIRSRPPSLDLAEWLVRVCTKLLTPGTTGGYSGDLDVHCSLMDAALNEKPLQINIPK